jgi:hypothetical protein
MKDITLNYMWSVSTAIGENKSEEDRGRMGEGKSRQAAVATGAVEDAAAPTSDKHRATGGRGGCCLAER